MEKVILLVQMEIGTKETFPWEILANLDMEKSQIQMALAKKENFKEKTLMGKEN